MPNSARSDGPWFNRRSLERLTDPGTWDRGLALYISQHVLSLDIEPARDGWLLLGEVQGSKRQAYEVSIKLSLTRDGTVVAWDCECECMVGSQCKHGVALMLEAAQQGLRLMGHAGASSASTGRSSTAPYPPEQAQVERLAEIAHAAEAARAQAQAPLLRWLQDLQRTGGVTPEAEPVGVHSGGPTGTDKAEYYVYFLSVAGSGAKRQLLMEAMVSSRKKDGTWAKPRVLRIAPYRGQAVYDQASDVDHEVLQLISAMQNTGRYSYTHGTGVSGLPQGRAGQFALEQAASTGRLLLKNNQGLPGVTIRWGPPQTLRWEWHEVSNTKAIESAWVLRARVADSQAAVCQNQPPLYLDAEKGLCGPLQTDGLATAQLAVLFNAPPITTSALQDNQIALVQALGKLPAPPILQALTVLQGITPTACLHLWPVPEADTARKGLMQAQLRFDYQGHRGWWAGQGAAVVLDSPHGRLLLHRDTRSEQFAVARLVELGLQPGGNGVFGIAPDTPQEVWLRWADDGFQVLRDAGFELTQDDALQGWITHADTLNVQLKPQRGDDGGDEGDQGDQDDQGKATSPWFDLSLGMEINGQRHNVLPWLPGLIAQAAANPPDRETGLPVIPNFIYVRAPDGRGFVRLPTDTLKPWMAALLELVGDRSHDFNASSLKLSRLDALRTGAALGAGAVWEGAQALQRMVRQLKGQADLPEVPVPASVQAQLRPYQQQGVGWLQFLSRYGLAGILADDMGLGKTLQTLVHIQVEKDAGRLTRPALIIAPVSLMGNWQREAARFCPGLRSLVLHGKDRHGVADTIAQHDMVIAPYSLLQRDRDRWLEAKWHLVVLDEAQNIKNASTHAAQVVSQLQTRHRLCLSGTPMENHLGEIWSLFHFLMPGFLGSQKRFGGLFRTPIEKLGDPARLAQLRARITPFMLRRTKALVAAELPPKVETVMRVELSGQQADLYETIRLGMEKAVREALDAKGLAKSQITILDALLKLRQVCCDPRLVRLAAAKKVKASAKLEQLMALLPEMLAEGRRILLFSQFTSMLELIEAELQKQKLPWVKLTGQSQKRDALIEQFTSGQVPLFLISLKAGGVGLNLPQADTVIHYDPWWNPAVENQATDRAHRIGQTQSVWVLKLVAQGTIEERILALQDRKAALADSMYSGAAARKQPLFTESDLAELLRPLAGS